MSHYSGIWVPLVTPFHPDGRIDEPALHALVRDLVDAGVHGLVACGTTGEAAALDEDEQARVLQAVLASAAHVPVVMGVGDVTPAQVLRQCARWRGWPVAGFLVPPPSYVRPSQAGVIGFYREVAAQAGRPLIVYDIPYRTGVTLATDTLLALAGIDGIVAVKDCGGDAHKTQAMIADGRLRVLAGEDHLVFPTLCQGGAGAIAASAHLHARRFVAMYEAVRRQALHEARALHHGLAPMVRALFAEPNPAPLKAVLAAQGRMHPTVRAPLTPASACVATQALQAHDRCLMA